MDKGRISHGGMSDDTLNLSRKGHPHPHAKKISYLGMLGTFRVCKDYKQIN